MRRSSIKILVVVGCLAMVALTYLARSWVYRGRPLWPVDPDPPEGVGEAGESVVIHYHLRPPFYMSDGNRVHGLVLQPIATAFANAGIPHVFRETPARRQLEIIAANEGRSCAAGWFKTAERQSFALYSLPVYRDKPFVAVFRADVTQLAESETTLDRVLADGRLTLLVKEGYSYGRQVDEGLRRHEPRRLATTGENRDILRMIEHGRADYSFMTEEEAMDLLGTPQVDREKFRVVRFADIDAGGWRYVICSRMVGAATMARLDEAIRNLHSEGAPQ